MMSRTVRALLVMILVVGCWAAFAWAESPRPVDLARRLAPQWRCEVTPQGRVRSMRGLETPSSSDRRQAARAFLQARAPILRLDATLSDMRVARVVESAEGPVGVYFERQVGGLPVIHGGASVHFDRQGRIFLAHAGHVPEAQVAGVPTLGAEAAFARLREQRARSPRSRIPWWPDLRIASSRPVVFASEDRLWPAHEIVAVGSAFDHRVRYYLDATSGRVLEHEVLVRTDSGQGRVIFPHPLSRDPAHAIRKDGGDFSSLYETVTLSDIQLDGSNYALQGPNVSVVDLSASSTYGMPANTPPVQASSLFNFDIAWYPTNTHVNDCYDDVLAYWAIDGSARYLRSLGYPSAMAYSIPCDTHGLEQTSSSANACYVSSPVIAGQGSLYFGVPAAGDPNDPAEDATVILHEYGHAIQDNFNGAAFIYAGSSGGVMEGFADYWSASACYQANVANGYPPSYVGAWFMKSFDPSASYMRDLANTLTYPDGFDSEVHGAGRIAGALFWDVLLALGKDVADPLVIRSLTLVPADGCASFDDLAQALLDADTALYGGTHQAALRQVFTARGLMQVSQAPEKAVAPYRWIDATAAGQKIVFADADEDVAPIQLPFAFRVAGRLYPQGATVYVSPNGIVYLSRPSYATVSDYDLSAISRDFLFADPPQVTTAYPNSACILADDLQVSGPSAPAESGVYVLVTGTAPNRVATIQFNRVRHYQATEAESSYTVTFEAHLYEGANRLEYQYRDMAFGNYAAADAGALATSQVYLDYRRNAVASRATATLTNGSAFGFSLNPLEPPSGVAAAPSGGGIALSWASGGGGEEAVAVERRVGSAATWNEITRVPVGTTTWADTGLLASTAYSYRLRSVFGNRTSDYSAEVAATTSGQAEATVSAATTGTAAVQGPGGGGGGGGCFIATAAYGSSLDPHVASLRRFRDEHLLTCSPGRAFVRAYYACSPPLAAFIARHEMLRAVVRGGLAPLVLAVEQPMPVAVSTLGLVLAGGILVGMRRRRNRRLGGPAR